MLKECHLTGFVAVGVQERLEMQILTSVLKIHIKKLCLSCPIKMNHVLVG